MKHSRFLGCEGALSRRRFSRRQREFGKHMARVAFWRFAFWRLGVLALQARETGFLEGLVAMGIVGAKIHESAVILHPELVNIYGCEIGAESRVGPFVEIQKDAHIGARCKIQSHAFICEGVTLEEGVFVGHGVMFVNDRYPRALNAKGELAGSDDWKLEPVHVGKGVTIGSNATIMCGVHIGAGAMVGAGAVVTRDVPPGVVVVGVPARILKEAESVL